MVRDRISTLKSLIGGDPQALVDQMSRSGAVCTLPDGTRMPVSEVIRQCRGKSPDEAFRQMGLDFSQIRPLM